MKILIAPNSMKGSLSAFDFADITEKALLDVSDEFEIKKIPVADGGDLTGEVLSRHLGAKSIEVEVSGPLGKRITSKYSVSGRTAIIEMADASGMKLIKAEELNPLLTSSFGTGELIKHAIESGCSDIYLAIGGSATVDGGLGMIRALGFELLDREKNELKGRGQDLIHLKSIRKSKLIDNVTIQIICDVDNPLLGINGAAHVFGPQKGATSEVVDMLEEGLKNLADILFEQSGKDVRDIPGAGAAGGISLPLVAFGQAEIVPGADFICERLEVEKWTKWADLVITGEGKVDSQTLNNKAPFAVSKLARKYRKPVFAIGGKVEEEASPAFDGCFSLVNGPVTLAEAIENANKYLYSTVYELGRLILAMKKNMIKNL